MEPSHPKKNKGLFAKLSGPIRKFFSIDYFCDSKKLSDSDIETVKKDYVRTLFYFCFFVSSVMVLAMGFYYIYGFCTDFFFNGTYYGYIKFSSVTFMFFVAACYLIFFFLYRKRSLNWKIVETIVFGFELFVLMGVFLFFVSDCLDPLTESSFSAGFLWMVVLGMIPCLSIIYWGILSVESLGGTIVVTLLYGSKQAYAFQYYLIIILVVIGNFIIRTLLFQNSYYRFAEVKSGNENLLISKTDALTGIENRRGLETFAASKEKSWALREDEVTLVIFDVDFFKQYNDYYGHIKGDKALQDIVSSIVRAFPYYPLDFFRYGGDEFIIIFAEPSPQVVDEFCEKIVEAVRKQNIKGAPTSPSPLLSVSLGASTMKVEDPYSLNEHISLADSFLYEAKKVAKGSGIVNGKVLD